MAERRLALSVQDDDGVPRQGEILIVRAWRGDVKLPANGAFTIVLAQEPLAPGCRPVDAANVVVCAPSAPVRIPEASSDISMSYAGSAAQPVRLSAQARSAYAGGTLLAARPLAISMRELFDGDGAAPRFEALARELLATGHRADRCWQTLDEVLSSPRPPAQVTEPERIRARLVEALQLVNDAASDTYARDAIDRLRRIARGDSPDHVVPSTAMLAEDAALLRCLIEQPAAARELLAVRAYLSSAHPGNDDADLAADHAFTLEQLSFLTLLEQPHQLDRLRATFEMFRNAYAFAYVNHHAAYWQEAERLRGELDRMAPAAEAIARLNTLRALGRPVGEGALTSYQTLASQPKACETINLPSALVDAPACPQCRLALDDEPPSAGVARTLVDLRTALAAQQTRLAGEAVRRFLARGGERLDQFLRVVQAADVAAFTEVLDDELLSFLRELLTQPDAPAPVDLLREIARGYPVASEAEIDALLETLRTLLREQLAEQRTAAAFPPPS